MAFLPLLLFSLSIPLPSLKSLISNLSNLPNPIEQRICPTKLIRVKFSSRIELSASTSIIIVENPKFIPEKKQFHSQ